jgi:hypothetical protein
MDFIDLVQDMYQWWAVVNTVMNIVEFYKILGSS